MLLDQSAGARSGAAAPAGSALRRAAPAGGEADLREFVRAHEVCWESEWRIVQRHAVRQRVGYQVLLYGRHPAGLAADPADDQSRRLQRGLARLARQACPETAPEGILTRVTPQPARLVLRPENKWTPEMVVRLDVLHAEATFGEASDAQKEYVQAIETRLAALGVRRQRWNRSH